jgi:UV DNA damage endonuclease
MIVKVRFGYVAMSTVVSNASPSKNMTATSFSKLVDREAAIRKLERIAQENIHNTLRLLKHNRAHDIHLYRMSSRLVPLVGHEMLADWDPYPVLADDFAALGEYARQNHMRLSFHPDHFTVLSTPREDVLRKSKEDLERHTRMLELMGLDHNATCNIHIGGTYNNRTEAMQRFLAHVRELPERIRERLTLENDDKTFTAKETLEACEALSLPMVLDIHHHQVNNQGEAAAELWPRIHKTWVTKEVPPKIHVSSPKSEKDSRSHADYVEALDLLAFLRAVAVQDTPAIDVMIEAKMKDSALFKLMEDLNRQEGVEVLDQASVEVTG